MISPKRPSGFNEFLPADQMAFNAMISVIRLAYEQYGYSPIETPALELSQVLLAKEGGETAKQVYRFMKGDTDLSLRFDLTVPLARYVAEHYNELAFPFRRYQIQDVWRAEKAQAGRYRQFYQCDTDILGSSNPMADADVILTALSALRSLGLKDIEFRISHRGLVSGFLEAKKLAAHTTAVLRAVDKLDKQGEAKVVDELLTAGITKLGAKEILNFVNQTGPAKKIITDLAKLNISNPLFTQAVENLKNITDLLSAGGMKANEFTIDLRIARGFDYYTGVVFEMFLKTKTKIGSIGSGGRYDNLLGHYHKNHVPGVGASIGLSRLFSALQDNLKNGPATPANALIVSLDAQVLNYSLNVATKLRQAGLSILVYPGAEKAGKQFSYADKLGISCAIVIGSDEAKKKTVTIKNMRTGKQSTLSLSKAAATIRKIA